MRALSRALRDLLTPRFLGLSLLPVLAVVLLLFGMLASLGVELGQAAGASGEAAEGWLVELFAALPWVGGLAGYGWFRAVLELLGQVAGWLLALLAALFFSVAVVGLLSPWIVGEVARRHYPRLELRGSEGALGYLRFLLRSLGVFLALLLLVLPLLLVPGLNLLALNVPFYYWFHRLLSWDVASVIEEPGAARALLARERLRLLPWTLLLYLLSLLPLLGLLLPVFFLLLLAHLLLAATQRQRAALPG
ncbi:MAG TPA: EI24 domain-containing protein [Gammaproteobacteria bacterium]